MTLKTLIIDDEPIALEKLKKYTERVPFLELSAECQNGFDAMAYLADNDVDLIVTDINMPDITGMDFVKTLRSAPMVIFVTAHPQYAVDSYKVSAVDYLLKPYGFVDFQRAVNKAYELYSSRHQQPESAPADGSMFIKVDYRYVRVSLSDIKFIKGYGEYLQIYLAGQDEPLVTLSSFAAIKERLTADFMQVHRSYIVNMNRVMQIERNRLVMDSENYIPVGDSYRADLQQYLGSHTIGKPSKQES